ncbi:universal stress protein [Mycolicibacterium palauense]
MIELSREARLLVVGSRGTGTLRGRYLGSVSWGLVHHAHCPVAIIHDDIAGDGGAGTGPVLVGIDGTPESEPAVSIAFDEASRRNVSLVALHAWKDISVFDPAVSLPGPGWPALHALEAELLSERLAGWSERYPDVTVHRLIVRDDPVRQLVDQSESAQLVVVGSHGSGGFAGMLLGSTSAAVVLLARAPVIVARQPGR